MVSYNIYIYTASQLVIVYIHIYIFNVYTCQELVVCLSYRHVLMHVAAVAHIQPSNGVSGNSPGLRVSKPGLTLRPGPLRLEAAGRNMRMA